MGLVGAIVWLSPDSLLVRLYTCDAVTQLFYKNIFFSLAIVPVLIAVKGGLRNALRATKVTGEFLAVQSLLFTLTQFAFTLSITNTAAATTLALLASSPLFASAFSRLIIGEHLTVPTMLAMCGGLIGVGIVFIGNLIAVSEAAATAVANSSSPTNVSGGHGRFLSGGGGEVTAGNDSLGIVLGLMCAISIGLYLTIMRYITEKRPEASELAPLIFVGPICCVVGLFTGAYVIVEPMDLLWAFIQGSIVGSVAFGTISVCPRYLLSSEVGLVQLLETVLGPFWVWLAGFESPPILTLYGGFVLLLTLTVYFSYTMYQDKVNAAALEGEGEKGEPAAVTDAAADDASVTDIEI